MTLFKNSFFIKLSSWEYWPSWVLYVPVYLQHIWLAIKTKNLFFFLRTNPAINGFILSDSKYQTQSMIPNEYLPKTYFLKKGTPYKEALSQLEKHKIVFPLILKPDIGFRGLEVHKIDSAKELEKKMMHLKVNALIQEYINYPIEIGVFYYRLPNANNGEIPSVTLKEFLSLKGDGKNTFKELLCANPRAKLQEKRLKTIYKDLWNTIIPKDKELFLEPIGNHNRGTKFINGNTLIDQNLKDIFDNLCVPLNGFYFGRFDIKAKSISELKRGNNFKILEINGVGGEPTHIYDPNFKLIEAWKTNLFLWRISAEIAAQNFKNGISKPTFKEAYTKWSAYKKYKRAAFGA